MEFQELVSEVAKEKPELDEFLSALRLDGGKVRLGWDASVDFVPRKDIFRSNLLGLLTEMEMVATETQSLFDSPEGG